MQFDLTLDFTVRHFATFRVLLFVSCTPCTPTLRSYVATVFRRCHYPSLSPWQIEQIVVSARKTSREASSKAPIGVPEEPHDSVKVLPRNVVVQFNVRAAQTINFNTR